MEQQTHTLPAASMPVDPFPAYSATIGQVAAALAKAQATFPEVRKNKHVRVQTRNRGSYEFDYADLNAILAACKNALTQNQLSVSQLILPNGQGMVLRTLLMHSSGEFLSSAMFLNRRENPQELGSEITYMKRYALSSMLGIAADDDDDGNLAAGNDAQQRKPNGQSNGQRQQDRKAPAKPDVQTVQVAQDKDGNPDWKTFAEALKAEVKKAPDVVFINELVKAHNGAISNLKSNAPDLCKDLEEFTKLRRGELSQAPIDTQAAD